MAFAPRSSGWREATSEETIWMEIFLRGGSAWEEFGRPPFGSEIEVKVGA